MTEGQLLEMLFSTFNTIQDKRKEVIHLVTMNINFYIEYNKIVPYRIDFLNTKANIGTVEVLDINKNNPIFSKIKEKKGVKYVLYDHLNKDEKLSFRRTEYLYIASILQGVVLPKEQAKEAMIKFIKEKDLVGFKIPFNKLNIKPTTKDLNPVYIEKKHTKFKTFPRKYSLDDLKDKTPKEMESYVKVVEYKNLGYMDKLKYRKKYGKTYVPSHYILDKKLIQELEKNERIKNYSRDATPFKKINKEDIREEMHKMGFGEMKKVFYSGVTGRRIKTPIFIGTVYYMVLKHTVRDKFYVTDIAKRDLKTRQPNRGKSKGGGIRFGNQEVEASFSQGIEEFIRDRLMRVSDQVKVGLCEKCGVLGYNNDGNITTKCTGCDTIHKYSVTIPYATKSLANLLATAGIDMRFRAKPSSESQFIKKLKQTVKKYGWDIHKN
mgnify:FL=1